MALYPDVQRRAQEELDRVVGKGRLPDFSDQGSLPYVNAVVKELLRWHPVLPTGKFYLIWHIQMVFLNGILQESVMLRLMMMSIKDISYPKEP